MTWFTLTVPRTYTSRFGITSPDRRIELFRLLDPPPPVCETAHYTQFRLAYDEPRQRLR